MQPAVRNKCLLMELLSAFAPELDVEDILERMVRVTQKALQVERVYVFLIDEESDQLKLAVRHNITSVLPA